MINLVFSVIKPDVPDLSRLEVMEVRSAAAAGVQECVANHLYELPGKRFYREAGDSVVHISQKRQDVVKVTHTGFALQLFGGTVKAGKGKSSKTGKRTKFLAIPANKSMSPSPLRYPDLTFIKLKGGKGALVNIKEDRSFTPMFWLVKQATIKPHLNIMPSQEEMDNQAKEFARDSIDSIINKKAL